MTRLAFLLLLVSACKKEVPDTSTDSEELDPVEQQVTEWLADMSLDEKIDQMAGSRANRPLQEQTRPVGALEEELTPASRHSGGVLPLQDIFQATRL